MLVQSESVFLPGRVVCSMRRFCFLERGSLFSTSWDEVFLLFLFSGLLLRHGYQGMDGSGVMAHLRFDPHMFDTCVDVDELDRQPLASFALSQ